jgi:hypothetical protein
VPSERASTEHFQQCAEFLLLGNRGPGSLAATPIAHSTIKRVAQFSMRGDVTLAPFLFGHPLVRNGVNDIGLLRALVDHPQVLAIVLAGCACAASGHAAAPPSSVMNSRRFIR